MISRPLRYLTLLSCVLLAATAYAQPATTAPASTAPADPAQPLIDQAINSLQEHNLDGAMIKLDAAIKQNPRSKQALVLRGCIYGTKKLWNQAEADFNAAALVAPSDMQVKFLRADVKFSAKDYETARDRYSELVHDPDRGDLASFQIFLCDMALGRKDDAKKEFDAFNAAGENPSYYYSNAVWSLANKNIPDGRSWLNSAQRIYPVAKNSAYLQGLMNLGYLPLPNPN